MATAETNDLARIEAKLDQLTEQMSYLVEKQRMLGELYEEMMPIATDAMAAAADQLGELERKGYFAFGKELLGVLDHVVTGYTPDDVRALADNIVGILDMVRHLTEGEVRETAEGAIEALHDADEAEPVGMLGLMRSVRKDEDVRRGLAVSLEVLRRIGHTADRRAHFGNGEKKMNALLGPKRNLKTERRPAAAPSPPASAAPPKAVSPAASAPAPATPAAALAIDGVPLDPEGFLADPGQWSEDLARTMASQLGLPDLGDDHWKVIRFAREDFLAHGSAPNIRRITTEAGVTTKELYTLFPKGPAKMAARIAGVKKPVGCI
jgi:tRNA 2-thiouridine synthesizing protein E